MQRANSARRVSESIKEQGAQILQNNFLTEGDVLNNNVQFFISFNLQQKKFFFFFLNSNKKMSQSRRKCLGWGL